MNYFADDGRCLREQYELAEVEESDEERKKERKQCVKKKRQINYKCLIYSVRCYF